MSDLIRDLIEIGQRLEHVRSLPPASLIQRGNPARDGPKRTPTPLRPETRRSGPQNASRQ